MDAYVKTDKLGIGFIKQLIYEEIQTYFETEAKAAKLSREISSLEKLYSFMSKEEFDACKEIAPDIYKSLDKKIRKKTKEHISIQYNISSETKTKYIDIMRALKGTEIIVPDQFYLLIDLFDRKNFSDKTKIILLEYIRMHNIISKLSIQGRKINYGKLYEIIDIAKAGYEDINDVHIDSDRKNEMNSLINSIKLYFHSVEPDNIINLLPSYNSNLTFSSGYSKSDFEYIMTNILKLIRDELFTSGQDIINYKNYQDRELRTLLVEQYYNNLRLYNLVRNKYDSGISKYENDYLIFDEITKEVPNTKNILFASNSEAGESYFKKDLKDMSDDSYDSILKMLVMFQKDILPKTGFKPLNEAFPGMFEIRNDQIRITMYHDSNNNYIITGIFAKKSDNDRVEYSKRYDRQNGQVFILDELYNENIYNYLNVNKRNGGRARARIKNSTDYIKLGKLTTKTETG